MATVTENPATSDELLVTLTSRGLDRVNLLGKWTTHTSDKHRPPRGANPDHAVDAPCRRCGCRLVRHLHLERQTAGATGDGGRDEVCATSEGASTRKVAAQLGDRPGVQVKHHARKPCQRTPTASHVRSLVVIFTCLANRTARRARVQASSTGPLLSVTVPEVESSTNATPRSPLQSTPDAARASTHETSAQKHTSMNACATERG